MANQTMTFDPARLERFRQARDEARAADQDSFEFDGHPFLVRYADYLIEYLDFNIAVHSGEHMRRLRQEANNA